MLSKLRNYLSVYYRDLFSSSSSSESNPNQTADLNQPFLLNQITITPQIPKTNQSNPNPQHVNQFLSTVKWHVHNQLVALTTDFPSLTPKTSTYTHTDGRSVTLLQTEGTIPMHYQNVTYNIPIVLWLPESFPTHPPIVYVNPTPDMVMKWGHPFVDPSGAVTVPYLSNWTFRGSSLAVLARELSEFFARDPPLYSRRVSEPRPDVVVHNVSDIPPRPVILSPCAKPPSSPSDGRSVTLLQMEGTIPMHYQNVTYNIPIVLWLPESFPTHPPLVYVNPTPDMIMKWGHPFVDPSGAVTVPYLSNWTFPGSNLAVLVRELSELFARDPPLYSRRVPRVSDPRPDVVVHNVSNIPPRPVILSPCA